MRRLALLLLALLGGGCLSATGTRTRSLVVPATDERRAYAEELVARAHEKQLAQSRQWLRLGHWRSTWTGSLESEAQGDNFFLSPDGKDDPLAELDATLRGFFSDLAPYDAAAKENKGVQHPICQFPARFIYLSQALPIDLTRVKVPDCSRFLEFATSLNASAVTLVFSSYYLNNPASAFGHTFLRLRKRNDDGVAEDRRQLLDFGIDYSASVDTTFAPIYAVKGIFGMFPGVFGKVPFYYKVREYNDYESRDLWEYDLNLNQDQVNLLVAHVWELGSTFFSYYYLTANCSYQIVALIDLVLPEGALLDDLHVPVLPSDTVRRISKVPGLVGDIHFRPSLRSQFQRRVATLDGDERSAVAQLQEDPARSLAPFSDPQRVAIYDAAADLVDLRHAKEIVDADRDNPANRLKQDLLVRRAGIPRPSTDPPDDPPFSSMPQLGAGSRRLSLGGGGDTHGGSWVELGFRLALHDLADPTLGYPELSELEFLPTRLRWDVQRERAEVEAIDLVHILSLSSLDTFDPRISWEARLGSERPDRTCDCLTFHAQLGGGGALATANQAVAVFLLGETHLWIGGLDGIRDSAFGLGIGPMAGLRVRFAKNLIWLSTAEWLYRPDQDPDTRLRVESTLRWGVVRGLALDLSGAVEEDQRALTASTMLYF